MPKRFFDSSYSEKVAKVIEGQAPFSSDNTLTVGPIKAINMTFANNNQVALNSLLVNAEPVADKKKSSKRFFFVKD